MDRILLKISAPLPLMKVFGMTPLTAKFFSMESTFKCLSASLLINGDLSSHEKARLNGVEPASAGGKKRRAIMSSSYTA
jgi:hypothetical protein